MKRATAVIGAGYGDEGKGLVTSTLAHTHDIVVRHNGGAQAAHTVEYNDTRHVFGHFGSGTLQGVPTYLSRHFIVNPIIFRREWEELKAKGITPKVYIDINAMCTLPYDMLINQLLETARGTNRHGSCGLGINETITRNLNDKYVPMNRIHEYSVSDIVKSSLSYFRQRIKFLQIQDDRFYDPGHIKNITKNFALDVDFLLDHATLVYSKTILNEFDNVLFEGAQGLMLDEYYGEFPYVTRSRTGTENVKQILTEYGCRTPLEVYYITRHYATRHGAGPLMHESEPYVSWGDKTNVYNEWQKHLRYGLLDLEFLKRAIEWDTQPSGIKTKNNLVITCMDQHIDNIYKYVNNGRYNWGNADLFIAVFKKNLGIPIYTTASPKTKTALEGEA